MFSAWWDCAAGCCGVFGFGFGGVLGVLPAGWCGRGGVVPGSALGWFGVPGVWARPGCVDGLWLLLPGVEARSDPLWEEPAGDVVGVLAVGDGVLDGDDWAGFWFGAV
ncbi:hypothetical protein ABZZ80_13275 [Streptomyces sp. NPDC006356]